MGTYKLVGFKHCNPFRNRCLESFLVVKDLEEGRRLSKEEKKLSGAAVCLPARGAPRTVPFLLAVLRYSRSDRASSW